MVPKWITGILVVTLTFFVAVAVAVDEVTAAGVSNTKKNLKLSKNENYFLYEMLSLSDAGRYLNQSEMDFEALLPSCTCLSQKQTNCSQQCCYCQMGCPVPEHSFTNEIFLPSASLSCTQKIGVPQEIRGRKRSSSQLPWLCDRAHHLLGQNSQWFPLLCVQGRNLNYFKRFFDINPAWTAAGAWNHHVLDKKYNWRNNRKEPPMSSPVLYAESRNNHDIQIDPKELLMKNLDNAITVGLRNRQIIGDLNYTTGYDDISKNRLFHVQHPLDFKIYAPTSCSQLSGGRALQECNYLIKFPSRNCTQLREAVLIAARVFAFTLTNVTKLDVRVTEELRKNKGNGSETDWNDCESIPDRGVVTEVLYRSSVIGVYVRFDRFLYNASNEIPVSLSYNQVFLSEQVFSNLPRFWDEILYGKCPEQFCWRDVGKFGPSDELWRLSNLDKILAKNIIYCFVPLLPIFTYFLVETLL